MTKELLKPSKRTLNFTSDNPIETLTLDELKSTYMEHNVQGEPMYNNIYHHDLIDRVASICERHKLDYNIEEIFAAQNKRKGYDGVAVAPHMENEYGKNALEAHALRRVFTTIRINNKEDEESNTGLVIAYHQDGIQLAIGPNIKMCHNQCILGRSRVVQTYGGDDKVKDIDKIMDIVDDWLHNFDQTREHDIKVLEQMKLINTSYNNVMELIGRLNAVRVAKDSKDTRIKDNVNLGKTYPLNQAQISEFTEKYLLKCVEIGSTDMSLFEVYNIATELYKPGKTDFPNIIAQNIGWAEFLVNEYKLTEGNDQA